MPAASSSRALTRSSCRVGRVTSLRALKWPPAHQGRNRWAARSEGPGRIWPSLAATSKRAASPVDGKCQVESIFDTVAECRLRPRRQALASGCVRHVPRGGPRGARPRLYAGGRGPGAGAEPSRCGASTGTAGDGAPGDRADGSQRLCPASSARFPGWDGSIFWYEGGSSKPTASPFTATGIRFGRTVGAATPALPPGS